MHPPAHAFGGTPERLQSKSTAHVAPGIITRCGRALRCCCSPCSSCRHHHTVRPCVALLLFPLLLLQVRLCLDKQDYVRAQILSKKIAPRAFVERKGEVKGEIGIEGTAIEAPPEVRGGCAWRQEPATGAVQQGDWQG